MNIKALSLSIVGTVAFLAYQSNQANLKVAREMYGELSARVYALENQELPANLDYPEVGEERPNATPVYAKLINESYNVKGKSVVLSHWLNNHLGGVLSGKGDFIIKIAKEKDICPVFLAAVAMHESANGTSKIAKEKRNVCGIMISGKTFKTFDTVEDSLSYTANLLSGKIYKNCKTVADIQRKYCPVGVKNDPKGLNVHWKTGVVKYMKRIAGEAIYAVRS